MSLVYIILVFGEQLFNRVLNVSNNFFQYPFIMNDIIDVGKLECLSI